MRVKVQRQVNAPIERVFQVCTEPEHWAEHISGIVSVEVLTDGPFAVGTKWTETRKKMGSETMWVTAMDAPRSYTVEAESCGSHYTSVSMFEEKDGGTFVTMTFEGKAVSLFAKLMSPMMALMSGMIRKMLARDLEELAEACERMEA